jgi:hypothetical protein
MIRIWTYCTDKLNEWVSSFVGDMNMEFTGELTNSVSEFLRAEAGFKHGSIGTVDAKYVTLLKHLDNSINGKEYEPTWNIYDDTPWTLAVDLDKVEEAVSLLKKTGDFFYMHAMVMILFGGITEKYLFKAALEENEELLKDIYLGFKVNVTAKKMMKEFSEKDVLKAVSFTNLADPVNPSEVPPYALDSTSIVEKDGNYYLTYDILRALTAAGGVAQALERQDLEGGVTNAASKQIRTGGVNPKAVETDEDNGDKQKD